jgi:hypothetical protein
VRGKMLQLKDQKFALASRSLGLAGLGWCGNTLAPTPSGP